MDSKPAGTVHGPATGNTPGPLALTGGGGSTRTLERPDAWAVRRSGRPDLSTACSRTA